MESSIFKKILKDEFDKLDPVLQKIYGDVSKFTYKGFVDVEQGSNVLMKITNKAMKFPKAGNVVEFQLDIDRNPNGEKWIRSFNGQIMETEHYIEDGILIDKVGPITLGFKIFVEEGKLMYEQIFTKTVKVKHPDIMSVNSYASNWAEDGGWGFSVEAISPVMGRLIKYKGLIKLIP